MTVKANTFEGQSSGTTWSTANSGGGSGDAFDTLTTTGSPTGIYDNAQASHGSNSLHITVAASATYLVRWTTFNGNPLAFRFYMRIAAMSAAQDLVSIRNSGAQASQIGMTSGRVLNVKNSAGTTLSTFTSALALNTWYRIEIQTTKGTTTSNGTIAVQYYAGDSLTPVETGYASGATVNTGTTNLTEVRFGKLTSATATLEAYFDSTAADDTTATAIGPPVATPASVVVPGGVVVADSTAPVISAGTSAGAVLAIPGGAATAAGTAPAVASGQAAQVSIAVPAGTAASAGTAPVVAAGQVSPASVTVTAGAVVAASTAPTVAPGQATLASLAVPAGVLTFAGTAPAVSAGGSTPAAIAVPAGSATTAATAAVVTTGQAASAGLDVPAGQVTTAGTAPAVAAEQAVAASVSVQSGSAVIDGTEPMVDAQDAAAIPVDVAVSAGEIVAAGGLVVVIVATGPVFNVPRHPGATITSTDRGATLVGTGPGVLYVFGDDLGEFPPLVVSQAGATIATHHGEANL